MYWGVILVVFSTSGGEGEEGVEVKALFEGVKRGEGRVLCLVYWRCFCDFFFFFFEEVVVLSDDVFSSSFFF